MLPSVTTNESLDTPRRRSSRRRISRDNVAASLIVESADERVAARKRKLIQRRQLQDTIIDVEDDNASRASHNISSLNDLNDDVSTDEKKKLHQSNSSRSLDDVTDMLERERTERVRSQNKEMQSRNHHLRQSAPPERIQATANTNNQQPQSSRRSSLPDLKTLLRHVLPSKKPTNYQRQEEDQGRSSSERNSRTSYNSRPSRDTEVQSEHTRSIQSEHIRSIQHSSLHKLSRRGSDTDLLVGSDRLHGGDTARRRFTPPSSEASSTSGSSPTLMQMFWQQGAAGTSQRRKMSTLGAPSLDGSSLHGANPSSDTIVDLDSPDSNGNNDQSGKPSARRQFSKMLSWRKSKRALLVQELSAKDSLRMREAQQLADSTQRQQQSPPPQQQHADEFSTEEEEWQVAADVRQPVTARLAYTAADRSLASQEPSPLDVSTNSMPARVTSVDDHQGHSSWPSSSEHRDTTRSKSSKGQRSSSVPSQRETATEESRRKKPSTRRSSSRTRGSTTSSSKKPSSSSRSRARGSKEGLSHSHSSVQPSSLRYRASSKDRLTLSQPELSSGSRASKSKTHGDRKVESRRSSHQKVRSKSGDYKRRRSTKTKKRHASTSGVDTSRLDSSVRKSQSKKKHASTSDIIDETSQFEVSRSKLDSSVRRSQSKRKPKSKREERDRASKRSPRSPKKGDSFITDISERSLTVDDIAKFAESGASLLEDSSAAHTDTDARERRKRKSKRRDGHASASARLGSSTHHISKSKAGSKSDISARQSTLSRGELSESFEVHKVMSTSRTRKAEEPGRHSGSIIHEERLDQKPPSAKRRTSKSPRKVGSSRENVDAGLFSGKSKREGKPDKKSRSSTKRRSSKSPKAGSYSDVSLRTKSSSQLEQSGPFDPSAANLMEIPRSREGVDAGLFPRKSTPERRKRASDPPSRLASSTHNSKSPKSKSKDASRRQSLPSHLELSEVFEVSNINAKDISRRKESDKNPSSASSSRSHSKTRTSESKPRTSAGQSTSSQLELSGSWLTNGKGASSQLGVPESVDSVIKSLQDSNTERDTVMSTPEETLGKKPLSDSTELLSLSTHSVTAPKSRLESDASRRQSLPSQLDQSGPFDGGKIDLNESSGIINWEDAGNVIGRSTNKVEKTPPDPSATKDWGTPWPAEMNPHTSPKEETRTEETTDDVEDSTAITDVALEEQTNSTAKTEDTVPVDANYKGKNSTVSAEATVHDQQEIPLKAAETVPTDRMKGTSIQTCGAEEIDDVNKRNTEAAAALDHAPDIAMRETTQLSIGKYLTSDAEVTEITKEIKEQLPAALSNDASNPSLPSLADFLSVDLSTESSKTDKSKSSSEDSKSEINSTLEKSMPSLHSGKSSAGQDWLPSLDAIADDSDRDLDPKLIDGPAARDLGLLAEDIFQDSPNLGPLGISLPSLWESGSEATVERLTSSMPNLEHAPDSQSPASTRDVRTPMSKSTADEGIFQDDSHSDDSPGREDTPPNVETRSEETRVDVMSEIAEEIEEHHETKALPASGDVGFRASLIAEFNLYSPRRNSAPVITGVSPRPAEIASSPTGKLDRGPRKPQRRSNSFVESATRAPPPLQELNAELEQLEKSMKWDEEIGVDSADQDPTPLAVNTTSMEFHRTDDNGWIQSPPESLSNLTLTPLPSASGNFNSSMGALENRRGDRFSWQRVDLRRRASMSDIEGPKGQSASERWNATGTASKEDAPPTFSRQPWSTNEKDSLETDGDELRHLFSMPQAAESKELARTYLPASLQSVARGAGKQFPAKALAKPGGSGRRNREIAVQTGLSDMFQKVGELAEDLAKFETQVENLRAQRARRLEEEQLAEEHTSEEQSPEQQSTESQVEAAEDE